MFSSYYHGSGAGAALMQAVLELAYQVHPDYLWQIHTQQYEGYPVLRKNGVHKSRQNYFYNWYSNFRVLCDVPASSWLKKKHVVPDHFVDMKLKPWS